MPIRSEVDRLFNEFMTDNPEAAGKAKIGSGSRTASRQAAADHS